MCVKEPMVPGRQGYPPAMASEVASLFTWQDRSGGFCSTAFKKCELLQDLGGFPKGTRFRMIIVYWGSGNMLFCRWFECPTRVQGVLKRDQRFYYTYMSSCYYDLDCVKRRRLNAPGDDNILIGNNVYSEKDVIKHVQRTYKAKYWAGPGFRKLSRRNKGAKLD